MSSGAFNRYSTGESSVDAELLEIERQIAALSSSRSNSKIATIAQQPEPQYDDFDMNNAPDVKYDDPIHGYNELTSMSTDELQRQIDELQRQLNGNDSVPRTTLNTETTTYVCNTPGVGKQNKNKNKFDLVKASVNECLDDSTSMQQHVRSNNLDKPAVAAVCVSSIAAKTKHQWDKPAWAVASTDVGGDQNSILTESINVGLKKPNTGGYERKVFEKQVQIVKGTFQKPTPNNTKVEPRLVWIVTNINGTKAGKIVMHLHGTAVPDIVDQFMDLKGLELKYDQQSNLFYTDDIQPNFYILCDNPTKYLKSSSTVVYGHVQEGHDIISKMHAATSTSSIFTIKQSHIYPVKKTK